jgi:hypothetical protein
MSTIYGLIFVAAWSLSALAFTIVVMSWLSKRAPMDRVAQPRHFHDWGNLLLALVMLWTYFAFSQFLLIWSGIWRKKQPGTSRGTTAVGA